MIQSGDSIRVVHPLFQEEEGGSIQTSPLQLHIGKITNIQAKNLNELWHSRMPTITGFAMCAPCFAAEFDGKFYAAAIWSLPIAANRLKDGTHILELRRFAIAPDAPRNTASRMLGVMTKIIRKERPDIKKLISYQDTGAHKGAIYAASGWAAAQSKGTFTSWGTHRTRPGTIEQSTSPKIRWELAL